MNRPLTTLAVACLLGGGVLLGWALRGATPPTMVHASATEGTDNFAVATGLVDEDVEAFYFLDFLTGKLKATVINTRKGEFGAYFDYDITQDFAAAGRNPKYLMVTGEVNIPRGRGNSQISRSAVYITEATTGQMAAYVMPWSSSLQAAGKPQQGTFLRIGVLPLRGDSVIRGQ
ncbi:MAG: hypothetical protein KDA37_03175 [Planctomycetales bacterium]|nr:hypothetical protein [Planctomycetales bacterium]